MLLDLVARIDASTPVLFLDTGKHFAETLAYRDLLIDRLGLTNLRVIEPDRTTLDEADPDGELWRTDPDRRCRLRKVAPLAGALSGFDAWITGRKRYQGESRGGLQIFEAVAGRIKVNPLAAWTQRKIRDRFGARALPEHPLLSQGYPSVGCAPCTAKVSAGASARDGRWAGRDKTECGIHGRLPTAAF